MPNFNSATNVPAIYPGDSFALFNAETPASGQASQQVCLGAVYGDGGQNQLIVQSTFDVAPGSVSWKLQGSSDNVNYFDIASAAGTNTAGEAVSVTTNFLFVRAVEVTSPAGSKHTLTVRKRS